VNKFILIGLVSVAAFSGCVLGSGGDEGNPVVSELEDYCPARCAKYQECNTAVFDLKWGTLEQCERECNPWLVLEACKVECAADYPADLERKDLCVDSCDRQVSVDACKGQCEGISDQYSHDACVSGCTRSFSQACADVWAGIHDCYLNLECDRAIEYVDFGGSASGLGECLNDDGVGTSC